MKKILVTCPPMVGLIEEFQTEFERVGFVVTAPKVAQTMTEQELITELPKFDGWIIGDDPASRVVLEAGVAGSLRAAVKWGIGTDNVDLVAAEELGIEILNTPGMFGGEVADLAVCYLIGLAREAFFIDRRVRLGEWVKPAGVSLAGKTVGVLGLGDIGSAFSTRALAHEMNIIGWDPSLTESPVLGVELMESWPAGIERCDFLVFCCSLNNSTKHIFNTSLLASLQKPIRLINVSRGGLIDEDVLVEGLSSGKVVSAALDVFEEEPLSPSNPLRQFDKLIFGSHNASNTREGVHRTSLKAVALLAGLLDA